MSSAADLDEAATAENMCANCGIAEVDDINLEECTDCDLVKYCSDNCREEHREQHNEECKMRAAILHDNQLFTQPPGSHRGECPICFLPLSLHQTKPTYYICCCTMVCDGCVLAYDRSNGDNRCPFCREPANDEENDKRIMKRVKANDPHALRLMGAKCGKEGDYDKAVEYFTKAAELGDAEAHCRLGLMYMEGEGEIVEKDYGMAMYHWEKAAIGGHPNARLYLASIERKNGNAKRAAKHLIIAANLGDEKSMKVLWKCYSAGCIAKEELEATLRTHQAAIDAMRSKERDAAEAILRRNTASR
jgi:hypothetical protein